MKLPLNLYEKLSTELAENTSLERLSLSGSCCGDAALAVSPVILCCCNTLIEQRMHCINLSYWMVMQYAKWDI